MNGHEARAAAREDIQPIQFLFDPERIDGIWDQFPRLGNVLGPPAEEGVSTDSFPGIRKTARQIYRILAAYPCYPHLQCILGAIERCLSHGFEPTPLLRTRQLHDFESHMAELAYADAFLARGLRVRRPEVDGQQTAVPDSLVDADDASYVVEVYCPRIWEGMDHFLDELRLSLLNMDVPYDFKADIAIDPLRQLHPDETPSWFDPWGFSAANQTYLQRCTRIWPITASLAKRLQTAEEGPVSYRLEDASLNYFCEVRLQDVQATEGRAPGRCVCRGGPGISGYAPEGMFDQVVRRRVLRKMASNQTRAFSSGRIRVLIVDVSRLNLSSEFNETLYLRLFGDSVREHVDLESANYDVVAFCLPDVDGTPAVETLVLAKKATVPELAVHGLFS